MVHPLADPVHELDTGEVKVFKDSTVMVNIKVNQSLEQHYQVLMLFGKRQDDPKIALIGDFWTDKNGNGKFRENMSEGHMLKPVFCDPIPPTIDQPTFQIRTYWTGGSPPADIHKFMTGIQNPQVTPP